MSLKTVRVTNFQSIKSAELELGQLTVLVGPGRAGKSAILRAIRCALLNATGDDFIRQGEKECTVVLEFDDCCVTWQKERGKSATYGIDGKMFFKVGHDVPEEIRERLAIGEIEVDKDTRLTPQLQDQFDPVFVLSESGSRQAKIFGKVTRLDAVVTAQMECKKVGDRLRREAEAKATQLEELKEQREALPDVEKLQAQLDGLEEALRIATKAQSTAERVQEIHAKLALLAKLVNVDLETIGLDLGIATGKVETLLEVRPIIERYARARAEADAADGLVEKAAPFVEKLRKDYACACEEAEVCERCPFQ